MSTRKKPGEVEVPSDPTATIYPLFWATWEAVDAVPEFVTVHPNRPDRFFKTGQPRVTVGVRQSLTRNRRKTDEPTSRTVSRDDGYALPATSTTLPLLSSPQANEGSPVMQDDELCTCGDLPHWQCQIVAHHD